ncbi:MAG: hypothetical protein ACI4IQ_07020 [Eubacterium sp.]
MDSLYVFTVVLCNNDVDRDWEKFSVEALNQLAKKFLGRTGISDHSMKSSDQKARIFDTWVEKAQGRMTADGEELYQLKAKAYMLKNEENASLITEIEAGIKKEVSVSCSMGKRICSICGADKNSSRCEHIGGREYGGKTAFTVLSDAKDAYEFSFVAVPAQREAGVTKSFNLLEGEINMTEIIKALNNCKDQIVLTKKQAQAVCDHIDELESEAQLGRDYKKSLADEVIRLCALAIPEMDLKTFGSVAQVMTARELIEFKKAFLKKSNPQGISIQTAPQKASAAKEKFNQFKI